ncbi:MAG TPA: SH3 domain-containing protein, partial [Candidatus Wallbacteria bacterium]|nr:SH3 domain-containing protein [Candidatus Wallbacteria bacterium]
MRTRLYFTSFIIAAIVLTCLAPGFATAQQAASAAITSVNQALKTSAISDQKAVSASPKKAVMTGDQVRIRKEPSLNGEIIGYASAGESFDVLEQSSGFVRAKFAGGAIGWVSAQYVSYATSAAVETAGTSETSEAKVGAVLGQGVKIRDAASAGGNVIHDVLYGSKVNIIEEKNGFLKVKTEDGVTGWISKSFVTTTNKELLADVEYSEAAFQASYEDFKKTYAAYIKSRSTANYDAFKKAYFKYRELSKKSPEFVAMQKAGAPIKAVIDKNTYTLTVYLNDKPVRAYPISYGSNPDGATKQKVGDCRTPDGDFKVLYKEKRKYEGVATRAMWLDTRWGDIGIHGTPFPEAMG